MSRFGLLLSLLLMLVAASVPAVPRDDVPYVGDDFSVLGGSLSAASTGYHELHDRVPGPATAAYASTTTSPHTWWVVWQHASGGYAPHAPATVGDTDRPVTSVAPSTSRPSRAPPSA